MGKNAREGKEEFRLKAAVLTRATVIHWLNTFWLEVREGLPAIRAVKFSNSRTAGKARVRKLTAFKMSSVSFWKDEQISLADSSQAPFHRRMSWLLTRLLEGSCARSCPCHLVCHWRWQDRTTWRSVPLCWVARRSLGSSLVSRHTSSHCPGMGKLALLRYFFTAPVVTEEPEKSVFGEQVLLMWDHLGRNVAREACLSQL